MAAWLLPWWLALAATAATAAPAAPATAAPAPAPKRPRWPIRPRPTEAFQWFSAHDHHRAGAEGGSFLDAPGAKGDPWFVVRGYASGGFFVVERSNVQRRDGAGAYETLAPLPFFGAGAASLYGGARLPKGAGWVRMALDYVSVPATGTGDASILAPARRQLLFESAAIEVDPLFWWAESSPRLHHAVVITAGLFVVPFGLEDENHASPLNWFATRPTSYTTGRIYPGTWSDMGVALTVRPAIGRGSRRPLEIDVAVVNGDPCTQTRFLDTLYRPSGVSAPCERVLRPGETPTPGAMPTAGVDTGYAGFVPDNNRNKSVVGRVRLAPTPGVDFGASVVWGRHPESNGAREPGETTVEVEQPRTYRVGAHAQLDVARLLGRNLPLPAVRAELVYGLDAAAGGQDRYADRRMLGGYVQIGQPVVYRRRDGRAFLLLQYRLDHADPDLAVPDRLGGVSVVSAFDDPYLYDEAIQSHTIGLRGIVLSRLQVKVEYSVLREDGGRTNQLANDLFGIQIVGDF